MALPSLSGKSTGPRRSFGVIISSTPEDPRRGRPANMSPWKRCLKRLTGSPGSLLWNAAIHNLGRFCGRQKLGHITAHTTLKPAALKASFMRSHVLPSRCFSSAATSSSNTTAGARRAHIRMRALNGRKRGSNSPSMIPALVKGWHGGLAEKRWAL